jgi:hypothetical protein
MELAGLEPATSCMPCRQPSSLSLACLQGISASSDGTTVGRFFAQFPPIPPGIGPTDALFGPILSSDGSARGSQQFGAFELDRGAGRAWAGAMPVTPRGGRRCRARCHTRTPPRRWPCRRRRVRCRRASGSAPALVCGRGRGRTPGRRARRSSENRRQSGASGDARLPKEQRRAPCRGSAVAAMPSRRYGPASGRS